MFQPAIHLDAYFAENIGMSFEHDMLNYNINEDYKPTMRWWTEALCSRNSFNDKSENEETKREKFVMSFHSSVLSCTFSHWGSKTIHCLSMQDYIKKFFRSEILTSRWLNRLDLFIAERKRDAVTLAFLGPDSPLQMLPGDTWPAIYKHL